MTRFDQGGDAPEEANDPGGMPEELSDDDRVLDLHTKLLRMRADFDNFRRRNATATADARREARAALMTDLLPVYDNFVRALEGAESHPEVLPFLDGFEMIRGQLEGFMRAQGVEIIAPAAGEPFDPVFHEATGVVAGDGEPDTVAHVVQAGFMLGDIMLRPAQVLVFAAD